MTETEAERKVRLKFNAEKPSHACAKWGTDGHPEPGHDGRCPACLAGIRKAVEAKLKKEDKG